MTISRDVPIHGTGHTVGEILDAAAQAGGGGGSGTGFTSVADGDNIVTLTIEGAAEQGISLLGGPSSTENAGGTITIFAGSDVGGGGPGAVTIRAGNATTPNYDPGDVILLGGAAASTGRGGNININATAGNSADSGNVTIGLAPVTGTVGSHKAGQFKVLNLPTADPTVDNAIWSDNGVLVQSGHTASGVFIPPTSDPQVAGALWNNAGTLAISAG